jgi:SAM-dependent methyltransferase
MSYCFPHAGSALPRVLHAGNGGASLPAYLGECEEVSLDADPRLNPNIVGNILDLGDIGPFDGIFCSHTLEHIYPHEVSVALREFRRVLSPGGHALIFVPDLEGVTLSDDVIYESPGGPVTAFDMFYGFRKYVAEYPDTMAHRCGFTAKMLEEAIREAGFNRAMTKRLWGWNLLGVGEK